MFKMKKLKMSDVPEGLKGKVKEKLAILRRTIRKDAVVLVRFTCLPEYYTKTLEFLKSRYDHILENAERDALYVIPLDHYGKKLSARDMFSRANMEILSFNYISAVMGFDAVAKWRTDELLAMTNLLVMFVQGKGQWEEFQRFWNAFGG